MTSIVDTHAHLDLPEFDDDRDAAIARALDAGVSAIVAIGFSPERWVSTAALTATHPMLVRSVGLHPTHANEWTDDFAQRIEREASHPDVVAIGEIGLDFYRDHADPASQHAAFAAQLALARQIDLPVVIHQRNAEDAVIDAIERAGPLRGVMHCFSGDEHFASRCLELGFHLGVGGVATYKASDAVRRALAAAPIDRLVLETDAPYLAPQGHRGSRNEPAFITRAAETIAMIRGMSLGAIAEETTRNAVDLFGPALARAIAAGESRRACA